MRGSNDSKDQPKVKKKKRRGSGWGDDESEEDEPDLPEYPPGIMKVLFRPSPHSQYS